MRTPETAAARRLGIGDLARLGGCSVDAIRYYERLGLMPKAARNDGGQRRYGEDAARRLAFVRRLRDLGFSLDEIRGFLALLRQPAYGCTSFREVADARLAEIRRRIGELRRLSGRIGFLLEQCPPAADAPCGILDALWDGALPEPGGMPRVCCGAPVSRRA